MMLMMIMLTFVAPGTDRMRCPSENSSTCRHEYRIRVRTCFSM